MDDNKIYKVKNRSAAMVIYNIPEDGIRREFAPGEEKKLTYAELIKLSYQSGGRELMRDFLQVLDEEVTNALNINTEPEYYMSEQQVVDLILKGSQEAFLDCLDFAPDGVIDLIKTFSVSLPMTDLNKIDALKTKTGFDVVKALENMKAEKEDEAETLDAPATGRRTAPQYKEERRTTPQYKVVSTSKE